MPDIRKPPAAFLIDDRTILLTALVEDGRPLLLLVALGLMLSGIFALFLAATGTFLPHDVSFLGMQPQALRDLHHSRIVHFMFHDRVSFGGTLLAIGTLYLWLISYPLRLGEEWAWWTLLLSGGIGFASFLAYLLYGYLDSWHAVATAGLLPLFVAGLWKTHAILPLQRQGWRSLINPSMPWTLRTRLGIGRACLLVVGGGMALAGSVITILGSTVVFVPQDLTYLAYTPAELNAINSHLIPLIAHDRAGFGGGPGMLRALGSVDRLESASDPGSLAGALDRRARRLRLRYRGALPNGLPQPISFGPRMGGSCHLHSWDSVPCTVPKATCNAPLSSLLLEEVLN